MCHHVLRPMCPSTDSTLHDGVVNGIITAVTITTMSSHFTRILCTYAGGTLGKNTQTRDTIILKTDDDGMTKRYVS